jgi:hypothetical protein
MNGILAYERAEQIFRSNHRSHLPGIRFPCSIDDLVTEFMIKMGEDFKGTIVDPNISRRSEGHGIHYDILFEASSLLFDEGVRFCFHCYSSRYRSSIESKEVECCPVSFRDILGYL